MKPREARVKVDIPARMRAGVDWTDLRIENMSSRGLMMLTKTELKTGSYIEVRHGSLVIVGRIVWTRGRYCGVRSQDLIDITAMAREAGRKDTKTAASAKSEPFERRKDELRLAEQAIEDKAARSRSFARAFQFIVVGTSAAAGCTLLAVNVAQFLRQVSGAVSAALTG